MAVRSVTRTNCAGGVLFTWTGLLNGDTGEPVECSEFGDRSFQATGTFGAGGSIQPQGSNDSTNYVQLKDPTSTALAHTSAGLKQILEATRMVRPSVTAGDGTTSLTATLFARRTFR